MKHLVVTDEELARERRRVMFAYIGSIIAQVISFALGWIMAVNWPQIVGRFA